MLTFLVAFHLTIRCVLNYDLSNIWQHSDRLQAVYPSDGKLWIIYKDTYYNLPFTRDYIDPLKMRIRLFGSEVKQYQNVYKDKYLVPGIRERNPILHLAFVPCWYKNLVGYVVRSKYPYVFPLQKTYGRDVEHGMLRYTYDQYWPLAQNFTKSNRYAVLLDGTGDNGYILRNVGSPDTNGSRACLVTKAYVWEYDTFPKTDFKGIPRFPDSIPMVSYYDSSLINGKVTFTNHKPGLLETPSATPLVMTPEKSFGFVYQKVIHLWDFSRKVVLLFLEPSAEPWNEPRTVYTVPMNKYFATESNWDPPTTPRYTPPTVNPGPGPEPDPEVTPSQQPSPDDPVNPDHITTSDPLTNSPANIIFQYRWAMIAGTIGLFLLIIIVLLVISICKQTKKKKKKKNPKKNGPREKGRRETSDRKGALYSSTSSSASSTATTRNPSSCASNAVSTNALAVSTTSNPFVATYQRTKKRSPATPKKCFARSPRRPRR